MTPERSGPPARWVAVLRRALPRGRRDDVVMELDELYRLRRARFGPEEADRWYRDEVMAFLTLIPLSAVGRRAGDRIRRWEETMGEVWRDVERAARSLARAPGFAAMAVAILTLGIGANTLIFSVVDHVVLRPLPYDQPDRLVSVWEGMQRQEVALVRERSRTLEQVGAYLPVDGFNLSLDDAGVRVGGAVFDADLLPVLGVRPQLGRNFRREETEPGRDGVALIGHGLWMDRFGGDPGAVGRAVTVDGRPHEVVGVLPAGFGFPHENVDVVRPMVMDPSDDVLMWGRGGHRVVGRMAPGVTPEQVRTEMLAVAEESRNANPFWTPNPGFRDQSLVVPLQEGLVGDVRGTLLILLGAVGLVLLVACANVANLMLTRGLARSRGIAVRAALGASRGRIVREHLIESLLLAGAGCLVALVAARWALDGLVAVLPAEIPRAGEVGLDMRVVSAGVILSLVAGALAGLIPALKGSRADPGSVLREGGRGGSASAARKRLSSVMVVVQMAVAVVLVVGAGLLVRSLGQLASVDPGFRTEGLTTARLTLGGSRYEEPEQLRGFMEQVVEGVEAIPGVTSASLANRVPFGDGANLMATVIDGVTEDPNDLPVLERYLVRPGFTETLGLTLLEGRTLRASDDAEAPLVVVVDETMARRFWPDQNPVGRRVRWPWRGAPWVQVVGVVSGLAGDDLGSGREPTMFVPMAQADPWDLTVVARSSNADLALGAAVRQAVRAIDPSVPVSSVAEMETLIAGSLARARWTTVLLGLFALTTLLLGCVGVYGVVAYSVRERVKEIGVRVALGADPGRIRAGVLRDGLRLALPGTLIGLALAVPATRVLEGLLFGVGSLDPVTFLVVPLALLGAGMLAVYVPAVRATRVDPVEALRSEA